MNRKFVVNVKLCGKSPTGQTHCSYQKGLQYHEISPIPQSCIGPISIRCQPNVIGELSKWQIQFCFTNVKWNIYPTSEWSTSFRQRNSIFQITELYKIDSSTASAARSDQRRDADIEIISKWHIHVGFTDVETRYLSDIEWRFGNRIPSYLCRFHIGCL